MEANAGGADRSAQLRRLLAGQARVLHAERRGVANDLHNGPQQLLVSIIMRLTALGKGMGGEEQAKSLETVSRIAQQAMEMARAMGAAACPPILQHGTLADALHWLAAQLQDKPGLAVEFAKGEGIEKPSDEIKDVLFDAARAMLDRLAAMPGARRAQLDLRGEAGVLVFRIVFSGEGFADAAEVEKLFLRDDADEGLLCSAELIAHYGGSITFAPTPPQGVAAEIRIPAHGAALPLGESLFPEPQ